MKTVLAIFLLVALASAAHPCPKYSKAFANDQRCFVSTLSNFCKSYTDPSTCSGCIEGVSFDTAGTSCNVADTASQYWKYNSFDYDTETHKCLNINKWYSDEAKDYIRYYNYPGLQDATVINGVMGCVMDGQYVCQKCLDGYTPDHTDATTGACKACTDTKCKTCDTDSAKCDVCLAAKYLDSDKKCQDCITNCSVCSDATTCTTCDAGYRVATDNTCEKCTASNAKTCPADKDTVVDCLPGFFLDTDKCTACESGCNVCTSATACTECDMTVSPRLFLVSGVCIAETKNHCLTVSAVTATKGFCTACYNSSSWILNTGDCVSYAGWDSHGKTYSNGSLTADGASTACEDYDTTSSWTGYSVYSHATITADTGKCKSCGAGCSACTFTDVDPAKVVCTTCTSVKNTKGAYQKYVVSAVAPLETKCHYCGAYCTACTESAGPPITSVCDTCDTASYTSTVAHYKKVPNGTTSSDADQCASCGAGCADCTFGNGASAAVIAVITQCDTCDTTNATPEGGKYITVDSTGADNDDGCLFCGTHCSTCTHTTAGTGVETAICSVCVHDTTTTPTTQYYAVQVSVYTGATNPGCLSCPSSNCETCELLPVADYTDNNDVITLCTKCKATAIGIDGSGFVLIPKGNSNATNKGTCLTCGALCKTCTADANPAASGLNTVTCTECTAGNKLNDSNTCEDIVDCDLSSAGNLCEACDMGKKFDSTKLTCEPCSSSVECKTTGCPAIISAAALLLGLNSSMLTFMLFAFIGFITFLI